MTPKLSLQEITVRRGKNVILAVPRLDVREGEVLAAVGPNGSGKSTLIQVIALLERPASGRVVMDGEPVSGSPLRYRRRMSVVFQEPLLLDTSVEGNVRAGLLLRGISGAAAGRRAARWLEQFGIAHLARRSARTLSGGEAQRTSLARAMVLEPELLLLDEPFAALDAPTRAALIDDLDRVLSQSRTTTVFVTHDRGEALRLGDRVAVLMNGGIRQIGSPSEVFAAPADPEVAAFVGIETIVPGRVRSVTDGLARVEVCGRELEASAQGVEGDVLVCVRPEDVVLSLPAEAPPSSARNRVPATIRRITPAGPHARVELDAGFPLVAFITNRSLEDLGVDAGRRVVATFKATAVHLIPRRSAGGGTGDQEVGGRR
jgi:tungstate transport system ATP-binding protein